MLKWLSVITVLLILIRCVHKPSAFEMEESAYGRDPNNDQGLITHKLQKGLPHPLSATDKISSPALTPRFAHEKA